jgi:hypothetical protein
MWQTKTPRTAPTSTSKFGTYEMDVLSREATRRETLR